MGSLVTLLAVARLVAPEPAPETRDSAPTTVEVSAAATTKTESETLALRPIDFRHRGRVQGRQLDFDLLDPFAPRRSSVAPTTERRSESQGRTRQDLRDPFAEPSPAKKDAAPDLRDPFRKPRALPKCPDTGGVPIQRPKTVEPGCVHASRHAVFASR